MLVASEFIICAALAFCFYLLAGNEAQKSILVYQLLLLVLFVAVFLTIRMTLGRLIIRAEEAESRLRREQDRNADLQFQFEQSSQDRIYELQVANAALNREIAERTQAEGELKKLQKQQSLILDSAGEGILGLNKRGRVTFMNRAASLMLGWEPEELLGHTHHSRIHHTSADGTAHPEEKCPIYQAYKDGKVHYKTGDIFWCKNGSNFPVEYVSTPIEDQGILTGAVVVFRDMTTYK